MKPSAIGMLFPLSILWPILIGPLHREFFSAPDAPKVIGNHLQAFFDELYVKDGRLWKFNMGPTGAIRVWIESDTSSPRITSYTDDQWKFHEQTFRKYTLDGPLNFYRVNLNGDQKEDDKREFSAAFSNTRMCQS